MVRQVEYSANSAIKFSLTFPKSGDEVSLQLVHCMLGVACSLGRGQGSLGSPHRQEILVLSNKVPA